MLFPVVALGIVGILKSGLVFLVVQLGVIMAFLFKTLLGKIFLGAIFFLFYNYFVATKIDAVSWLIGSLAGDSLSTTLGTSATINFAALGQLIELLRIEDCIFVLINAYISGFITRVGFSVGVAQKRGV